MNRISSDIQVDNGRVVLFKHVSQLLEAVTGEAVLADVDLSKFFVVFQDLCDYG